MYDYDDSIGHDGFQVTEYWIRKTLLRSRNSSMGLNTGEISVLVSESQALSGVKASQCIFVHLMLWMGSILVLVELNTIIAVIGHCFMIGSLGTKLCEINLNRDSCS